MSNFGVSYKSLQVNFGFYLCPTYVIFLGVYTLQANFLGIYLPYKSIFLGIYLKFLGRTLQDITILHAAMAGVFFNTILKKKGGERSLLKGILKGRKLNGVGFG